METRSFREIVHTVTVSYPEPFLFASLIALVLFCFGLAAGVGASLSWVFAGTGLLSFLVAVGVAIFALGWKPELLRSERHTLVNRVLDMIGDSDTPTDVRDRLGRTIPTLMDEPKSPNVSPDSNGGADHGEEAPDA